MGKRLTQEEVCIKIKENYNDEVELISQYVSKRKEITLRCKKCGHIWNTIAANALYLSSGCKNKVCPNCRQIESESSKIKVKCAYCGKEIVRTKSDLNKNKSGFFYCSKECGNLHKNYLRLSSGEWDNSNNYRLKAFNNFEHKCSVCGWNEDTDILEVHHYDENHNNNDINNLVILCPICHRKITSHKYRLLEDKYTLIKLDN